MKKCLDARSMACTSPSGVLTFPKRFLQYHVRTSRRLQSLQYWRNPSGWRRAMENSVRLFSVWHRGQNLVPFREGGFRRLLLL